MDWSRPLVLTIAIGALSLVAPACNMRYVPHAPAASGDVPAQGHARILLVAGVSAGAEPKTKLSGDDARLRVFDHEARPVLDLAPGQHGILDLPSGEHVLAAVAGRAPTHLGCVGALRAEVAAGHVYAAHVRVGDLAKVDALLARRPDYCSLVQFERVEREHVAALLAAHPTSSAVRHTQGRRSWTRLDDLDTAELISGAARLRTIHDDHQATIPAAARLMGFEASPAPAWSPQTSALRAADGIPVPPSP